MKTSELTGPALDWAVAKCEGHEWRCPWLLEKEGLAAWVGYERAWGNPTPAYSTDWSQGGPIIEREKIGTHCYGRWSACGANMPSSKACEGPTLLIAAMRCYTASKLGDYVDVPEELCQQPKT